MVRIHIGLICSRSFQNYAFKGWPGNYEIVAIRTEKNTFFNDLDYKADIGRYFHKSEKICQAAPPSQNNQNKS